MFRQHGAAKRIDLAEGDGLHPCPFEAEAEPADP
jgi:hypothetical protein